MWMVELSVSIDVLLTQFIKEFQSLAMTSLISFIRGLTLFQYLLLIRREKNHILEQSSPC